MPLHSGPRYESQLKYLYQRKNVASVMLSGDLEQNSNAIGLSCATINKV